MLDNVTSGPPLLADTVIYSSPVPNMDPESFVSIFTLPPSVSDIVNLIPSILILSTKYSTPITIPPSP